MSDLLLDVRFALRSLARGGVGIFVALATLVVALAASIAIFTVAQAILMVPVPAVEAGEVVSLARHTRDDPGNPNPMPVPTYFDWQERNRTLASLGAYSTELDYNLEGTPPERLVAVAVSGGFFPTLGIQPVAGQTFGEMADEPGAAALAVISHRLWLQRFGGSGDVLGRSLVLDGHPWEIVAVMPPSFRYPHRDVDVWLPLGTLHQAFQWENRSMSSLHAVGRRQSDVSLEQVRTDLERVTETIADDTGVAQEARPLVIPLARQILGKTADSLRVLGVAVFFVLLITCANVANLLLARGFGRGEEVAVRIAFGARRRQIVRLMLVESVALSSSACLLAVLLAGPLARHIVVTWIPESGVAPDDLGLTPLVGVFAVVLALVSGLAFGLPPALRHSRQAPAQALRQSRRAVASSQGLRSAMVVAEVAVATALLIGAGLMLRSIGNLLNVDPGFDTEGVLVQSLAPGPHRYDGLVPWLNMSEELLGGAGALPTVEKVAVSLEPPLQVTRVGRAARPGLALRPDVLPLCVNATVSEGYFDLLGMELLRGRAFSATDDLDHPLVAIVDESLAASFWPNEDPIGQRLALEYVFPPGGYREGAKIEAIWRTVVGVVPTARLESLRARPRFQAYMPLRQPPTDLRAGAVGFALLTKTRGEPLDSAPALQAVAAEIDPEMPVYDARSLHSLIDAEMVQERLLSSLLGGFGVLALLLAAAGVYAALAHLVARRTREMGVRLALGAEPRRLLRQVAWRGVRLALFGTLLGIAGSALLTRFLENQLYGIGRLDPLTFLAMPLLLLGAAAAACLLPAWRASRVDPSECLRYE